MADVPGATLASYANAVDRLRRSGMDIADIIALAERYEIASERAKDRNAPQQVIILINSKAYIDFINATDNYARVSRHGEQYP